MGQRVTSGRPALVERWFAATALILLSLATATLRAQDRAAEIASIHVAAIGGESLVQKLSAFRAKGRVVVDGQTIAFTITAARPNRVRMEYAYPEGTLIQATDGVHPPWELDARKQPAVPRPMSHAAAAEFLAAAEFDDPLVAGAKRGMAIEFAGVTTINRRPVIRVLVTQNLAKSFFLLLDGESYLILSRIDPTQAAGGDGAEVVTEYRNYRPIGGVLAAHAVTVRTAGRITEDAVLESAEANPMLRPDTFTSP